MTPVPGSAVRTRSRRPSASALPSATTTMPAWIELPMPTPPPWWTLTQVAPALQDAVVREGLPQHRVDRGDVSGVAREGGPPERPDPAAEERSDIGRDEARVCERVLDARL